MFPRTRALPTKPPIAAWKVLLPAAAALALGWTAWHWATRPANPAAQPGARSVTVTQDWQALRRFGPRTVGSPGHGRALDWAQAQFESLGYRVTRSPLTVTMPTRLSAEVQVGGQRLSGRALFGTQTADQQGSLVQIPAQATASATPDVLGRLAVMTCPPDPWAQAADRAVNAGALGLVIIADCARPPAFSPLGNVALPVLTVNAAAGRALLSHLGETATFRTTVVTREVRTETLVAARVNSAPEVLFGAHLDTVPSIDVPSIDTGPSVNAAPANATAASSDASPGSPGANDNASGVLSVLAAARRAAGTPLAERSWFVLFTAEEEGLLGSRAFARANAYPLRRTRAMLNLDMVGVNAAPLSIDTHPDLLALARTLRPAIHTFEDRAASRVTFGRSSAITGRSDQVPFKQLGVRTAFLYRGEDPNYHRVSDTTLDPALVGDTAAFAVALAQAALNTPWTPVEPCGITGRNCR